MIATHGTVHLPVTDRTTLGELQATIAAQLPPGTKVVVTRLTRDYQAVGSLEGFGFTDVVVADLAEVDAVLTPPRHAAADQGDHVSAYPPSPCCGADLALLGVDEVPNGGPTYGTLRCTDCMCRWYDEVGSDDGLVSDDTDWASPCCRASLAVFDSDEHLLQCIDCDKVWRCWRPRALVLP